MYTLCRPEGPERIPLDRIDPATLRERVRAEGLVVVHDPAASPEAYLDLLRAVAGPDVESDMHWREWEITDRARVTKPGTQLKKSQEWHLDESWLPAPANFASLLCRQGPIAGGSTEFVDLRVVLAALSPDERTIVEQAELCHSLRRGLSRMGSDHDQARPADGEFPPSWHPLVRRQPGTGDPVLFANPLTTNGWRRRSSRRPFPEAAAVVRRALAAAHPYVHRWRTGDTVIFDNSLMLHRRSRDAVVGRRRMVQVDMARVPVEAVHPINHLEGGAPCE